MDKLKQFVERYFEAIFVVGVLLATSGLNYLIHQKLAFLNFYFLPIILGAYFLGRRLAVLGAVFSVILVGGYAYLSPENFYEERGVVGLATHLLVWAGFLILAGATVGNLRDRLKDRMKVVEVLNQEISLRQDELLIANTELKDYSENLEVRVKDRTAELEQSKNTLEIMKQKVEGTLYQTMDPAVVKLIIEGNMKNEKRNISVLFSDIVNFTAYSEGHPPELVISELNRCIREIEPLIHAYHGHIDKYMGDGIMCEFGAPVNYKNYRLMAVLAGMKVQEKISGTSFPWHMRVGIASGTVVTGMVGHKRQTFTAIGDVVNVASRLENACRPTNVLIDDETYAGVAGFVDVRKVRQLIAVSNKADIRNEHELEMLNQRLDESPEDVELLYQIAMQYLTMQEPEDALVHIEKALQYDPDSARCKLAFADASLQRQKQGGISVKGKRKRVLAYEITGLKDPLLNRECIPESFYREYRNVGDLINIPNDLILPVESINSSIGHGLTTGIISYAIAGLMGIVETERLNILRAGYLANIGKEIIPHHVLNIPRNALIPSEIEIIRQYPIEGAKLLKRLGYENESMTDLVMHARERFNGTGYPYGLSGNAIPLGARIISLASDYVTFTSNHNDGEAWARASALIEIQRETEAGIYDPDVVASLMRLMSA